MKKNIMIGIKNQLKLN